MLTRANRLTKLSDFNKLKREGRVLKSNYYSLVYLNRGDGKPWRVGITVSKKTAKLAVVRNRLKRQYREVAKRLALRINPGYDVLFLVRGRSIGLTQLVLENEILKLLIQGGILS